MFLMLALDVVRQRRSGCREHVYTELSYRCRVGYRFGSGVAEAETTCVPPQFAAFFFERFAATAIGSI